MRCPLLPLLLATAVLSGCDGGGLAIESVQQGRTPTTSHGFVHEHWLQRDLWTLREREGLEEKRAAAADDWALQLELCRWTRAQFEPGFPAPYPRANGLVILDEIRAGRTKGFCGQYGYLFADALKSLGLFDVRYLELESATGSTHSTTEVWSDRWQKWIELDPFANAWYSLDDGLPLSALEIHEQLIAGSEAEVIGHVLEAHPDLPTTESMVRLHHRFAVSLRNDLADAEKPPTIADRHASYLLHVCEASPKPGGSTFLHASSRKGDFDSPRNQTFLDCETATDEGGAFDCEVSTRGTVAHFSNFLITLDGETWTETEGSYRWRPTAGDALSALAVNDLGWFARPATVRAVAP